MKTISVINIDRPTTQPLQVGYCADFLCRLRGLMFRSRLDRDYGLLLVQAQDSRMDSAIHMFFVFMDLAVIWINSERLVVDTVVARAWHPLYSPRSSARYILEINPERITDFVIGDRVSFDHA